MLQGRSVDDLSTATRGSCRRFIKDLRKRLASDMLAEQQRLSFKATLESYEAAVRADEQAGCVNPFK